ncbi:MAG: RES family NAD+ phosphorylase [Acidimicrobiales bacterium]
MSDADVDVSGVVTEMLPEGHEWLRICDPSWSDPLDPNFARERGQRWNPPHSFPVLYVNEDLVTARLNLRHFIAGWPFEPEDLRGEAAPCLVAAQLPRGQRVADLHTPAGVAAVGLPKSYPLDSAGRLVSHEVCQPIGTAVHALGLHGIRCRSARAPEGAARELAWFPAGPRSRARFVSSTAFEDWYYS